MAKAKTLSCQIDRCDNASTGVIETKWGPRRICDECQLKVGGEEDGGSEMPKQGVSEEVSHDSPEGGGGLSDVELPGVQGDSRHLKAEGNRAGKTPPGKKGLRTHGGPLGTLTIPRSDWTTMDPEMLVDAIALMRSETALALSAVKKTSVKEGDDLRCTICGTPVASGRWSYKRDYYDGHGEIKSEFICGQETCRIKAQQKGPH